MNTRNISILIAISVLSAGALAAASSASFDTQLNQAKTEIGRIADEGLYRSTSFDTQLKQAQQEIDRIAAEGRAAQGLVSGSATQTNKN